MLRSSRRSDLLSLFAVFIASVVLDASSDSLVPASRRSEKAIREALPRIAPLAASKGVRVGAPLFVRMFKEERLLEIWLAADGGPYKLVASYPICAFSGELGPKVREGDGQAPEGFYSLSASSLNPSSRFHLAFNLGYPNAYDRAWERTGSALMVHGNCVSIGCYAMTDRGIEEIYTFVDASMRNGQRSIPVHVFPFRMTAENLARHRGSAWDSFWSNLKEGYDAFEQTRRPPVVSVQGRRYRFAEGSLHGRIPASTIGSAER